MESGELEVDMPKLPASLIAVDVGEYVIDEAPLLPDLLKEMGAHAAADDGVEHVKGVPPRVRLAHAVRGQAQVDVLEVLFIHVDAGKAFRLFE